MLEALSFWYCEETLPCPSSCHQVMKVLSSSSDEEQHSPPSTSLSSWERVLLALLESFRAHFHASSCSPVPKRIHSGSVLQPSIPDPQISLSQGLQLLPTSPAAFSSGEVLGTVAPHLSLTLHPEMDPDAPFQVSGSSQPIQETSPAILSIASSHSLPKHSTP